MYFGYCLTPDGYFTPKVTLQTPEDVFRYTELQRTLWEEVRITDTEDFVVVQTKDSKYTYPPEWVRLNKR